ncbi:MAG: benzoate-CoA ligase family protein [Acidobacteria bacterium]|nr:MAG: benzoate-CoA ligase family protein [Acidobacteriota bacterium]
MNAGAPIPFPDEFNAAAYFIDRHVQEERSDKIAIECEGLCVTYRQLYEGVNRVGNGLRKLGVRIEERVFLLLLDTPEFAAIFFGAIKIGAIPVPVNTLLKPADYQYMLNNSRARVAIVSDSLYPQLQAIPKSRLHYLEHVIVIQSERPKGDHDAHRSDSDHHHAPGTLCFNQFIAENSPELDPEPTSKDDAAFWLYSSGSTGFPKACVHLQHDMVVCADRYAKAILNMTEQDRCFSVAKLFFAYGLGNALYFPLAVCATSILWPGPPKPQYVFELIECHRPTLFFSVPSNYAALLAHHREDGREFDLSSVRYGVSAGEALPAAIFHRFKERFGVEILDAIGSTEVLHMFIANRPGAVRPGSSGQIIPGYETKILDENGEPVKAGVIGNLLVKADSTCALYWNQHEKTKDTLEGHWVRTGDKYRQDEDGYFWYAGRSDDMLKVSGVWVSPVEIESVLVEHPAVQEAAVVGRKDRDELIKPVACVVLRDGETGTPELAQTLEEFVMSRLPIFKRPRWIEFFSELPKTATGKLQRFKLRQRFEHL